MLEWASESYVVSKPMFITHLMIVMHILRKMRPPTGEILPACQRISCCCIMKLCTCQGAVKFVRAMAILRGNVVTIEWVTGNQVYRHILYYIILYCIVLYYIVLYYIILYYICIILYYIVLYCIILYYIVL